MLHLFTCVFIKLILAYVFCEKWSKIFNESIIIIITIMKNLLIGAFVGFCMGCILYKIFGIDFIEHEGNSQYPSGLIALMIIGAASSLIINIITRSQMMYRPH